MTHSENPQNVSKWSHFYNCSNHAIFSREKGAQRGSLIIRMRCPYSLTNPYLIPYGMASQQLQLAAQAPYASFRNPDKYTNRQIPAYSDSPRAAATPAHKHPHRKRATCRFGCLPFFCTESSGLSILGVHPGNRLDSYQRSYFWHLPLCWP